MKTLTRLALVSALVGTLGLAGKRQTVYKQQIQPQVGIIPQHHSTILLVSSSTQPSLSQSLGSEKLVVSEQPAAPEKNPPGDIPDTQAFVTYSSTSGGYKLEVPEGWARRTNDKNVSFIDKLDGVKVTLTSETTAPTARSSKTKQVAELEKAGRAVKVVNVKDVQLPSGPAVLVKYTSNSEPDPVTGKQVRLENNSYLFFKNGKLATLRLWAPIGADNLDQWQRMSRSFRWLVA